MSARPPTPKVAVRPRGGEQVRNELKKQLYDLGLKGVVRANSAGCLDQCANGVTVVVYPEQVWYGGVTREDVSEIVERHILQGDFVTRLMLPDQVHLGGRVRAQPLDHPAARSERGRDRPS